MKTLLNAQLILAECSMWILFYSISFFNFLLCAIFVANKCDIRKNCTETVAKYPKHLKVSSIKKDYRQYTFRPSTRSMRCLPSGLMSFNTSAIMMSKPLLSWLAIAFCKTTHMMQLIFHSQVTQVLMTVAITDEWPNQTILKSKKF